MGQGVHPISDPHEEPEEGFRPRPHDHLVEPMFDALETGEDLEEPPVERPADLRTLPGTGCVPVLLGAWVVLERIFS